MRTLVFLLLLANLTLFGFTRLDTAGRGEPQRLVEQVQPEKIKLLTPQQVAALGPAKVAALADVCVEWGPFSDAERTRALGELEPLGLGRLLTQKRTESPTAFWVYLPPFPTKAAADRRATELRSAGLRDLYVVDGGAQRLAISLGVFRTAEAANVHVADLAKKGVTGARVGERAQVIVQTLLVIRDPPQAAVTKLREIAPAFPAAELKVGACERPG
jgi:hypothetical protein